MKLGNNPGCPCGGTHVSDISEIMSITVSICLHQHSYEMIFYIKNLYGYVKFLGDFFCYAFRFLKYGPRKDVRRSFIMLGPNLVSLARNLCSSNCIFDAGC